MPYIAPTLHHWERPYRGVPGLRLDVFRTGSIAVGEGMLPGLGVPTGSARRDVFSYVLRHPSRGLVVVDTGLHHRIAERPEKTPIGRGPAPRLEKGESLPEQMRAAGLDPDEVKSVILSNLRLHHCGELEAFAGATVVVSKSEHRRALEQPAGYSRMRFDDVETWDLVDIAEAGRPLGTLRAALDLFGDGSVELIDAAGPTAGNLVVMIRMESRAVVLGGDLAPLPKTVRYAARPAGLDDADGWWDAIWRLKRFKDLEPALLVVPGHSVRALREAGLAEVRIHPSPVATPGSAD